MLHIPVQLCILVFLCSARARPLSYPAVPALRLLICLITSTVIHGLFLPNGTDGRKEQFNVSALRVHSI